MYAYIKHEKMFLKNLFSLEFTHDMNEGLKLNPFLAEILVKAINTCTKYKVRISKMQSLPKTKVGIDFNQKIS